MKGRPKCMKLDEVMQSLFDDNDDSDLSDISSEEDGKENKTKKKPHSVKSTPVKVLKDTSNILRIRTPLKEAPKLELSLNPNPRKEKTQILLNLFDILNNLNSDEIDEDECLANIVFDSEDENEDSHEKEHDILSPAIPLITIPLRGQQQRKRKRN